MDWGLVFFCLFSAFNHRKSNRSPTEVQRKSAGLASPDSPTIFCFKVTSPDFHRTWTGQAAEFGQVQWIPLEVRQAVRWVRWNWLGPVKVRWKGGGSVKYTRFPLLRHLIHCCFPPLLCCLIRCCFPPFAALTFASRPLTLHGWNSQARVSTACACGQGGGGELAWVGPIAFVLLSSVGFMSSLSLAFVLLCSLRLLLSSMGFMPSSSLAFVSQPSLGCCPLWDSCHHHWCCCRHVCVGSGAGIRIVVVIWDPLVLTGRWFLSSHPSQEGRGFFPVWLCVFERD